MLLPVANHLNIGAYIYTHLMSAPFFHPQAPWINTISLHYNVWAPSERSASPHFTTSETIKTSCLSSSLAFSAIGRSLPSLIPADKSCMKKRQMKEKQNKHNRDNVFLLLPSDKCWAHRVASWQGCLQPALLVKRFRGGTRWESVFLPGLFSVTHHSLSHCSAWGNV